MTRFLLPVLSVLLCANAMAEPSAKYKEARAMYDQLKKPFYDTGIYYKKTYNQRTAYMDDAKRLAAKAEKLIGIGSQCARATTMRIEYIQSLNVYAYKFEVGDSKPLTWQDVTNPMYSAFVFGEATAACYDEVEALDQRAPK